jgi:hypothetical protein
MWQTRNLSPLNWPLRPITHRDSIYRVGRRWRIVSARQIIGFLG